MRLGIGTSRRGAAATPRTVPAGGSRFRGDPGPGKILTGATVYTGSMGVADGNVWLDENSGVNHLFKRIYYSNLWSRTTIQNYRNSGKMPSIAWKANGTAANIAAIAGGSIDASIAAEAVWAAGQGYPIYTAFYHEPEDNFPLDADAASYRAAYRRIVQIFRDNGALNVVWIGVAYQTSWSFISSGGQVSRGPWYKWDPDWKGTTSGAGRPNASDWYTGTQQVCNIMSFDQYSPTIGGTSFHEFSVDMQPSLDRMVADGRPIIPWIVPEMGTKIATGMPADGWTGYFQRALRYMRDHNGCGFVYYNTDDNNFLNGSDSVARFAGYQAALASEASYVVSARPPDAGVGGLAAQVTFVGAAVAGGNVTTLTAALPAGVQAGDVAYAFWSHSTTAIPQAGSDPPTGWVQVSTNTGTVGSIVAKVFRRVLTGDDTGPSVTMDGATRQSAALIVYRGLDITTPEDTVGVDTTHTVGTTHNAPTVATVAANCVIVTSIHERATAIDTDFTPGAGYTERGDTLTLAAGTNGTQTAVADNGLALVSAAGTSVTPSAWSGDNVTGTDRIVTYTLALRAATT